MHAHRRPLSTQRQSAEGRYGYIDLGAGGQMLMPEGVAQILSLIAVIFGVASIVGYGYTKGRVTSLRDELRDEREGRSSDRETIKELRADLVVALNDLAALGRVVTAEAHWVAIGDQLNDHHIEAKAYWARSESTANATLAALQALGQGETE